MKQITTPLPGSTVGEGAWFHSYFICETEREREAIKEPGLGDRCVVRESKSFYFYADGWNLMASKPVKKGQN